MNDDERAEIIKKAEHIIRVAEQQPADQNDVGQAYVIAGCTERIMKVLMTVLPDPLFGSTQKPAAKIRLM